ncbi:BQ2448_2796 [Microbotryum intermedium]|uniref:BQ2448_2796 protein n=1 Tax=Microbotryum intermedium TaxID=269621 RepID=A0A238FJ52_9BASI|nr:BQ2448_2796 [Microbotryum intermedium]
MFELQAYSWALKIGPSGTDSPVLVTKPFEIPPPAWSSLSHTPLTGVTLSVDGNGIFMLKVSSQNILPPQTKLVLYSASCEVWSLDRTARYHVHRFVTRYRKRSTIDLSWSVRGILENAFHGSDKEFAVVLKFGEGHVSVEEAIRRKVEYELSEIRLAEDERAKQDPQQRYKNVLRDSSSVFDLGSSAYPFDVRFVLDGSEKKLWENATFLASRSSYLADLFSSGYSESLMEAVRPQECKIASRTVRITEGSVEDYQAAFVWLRTGHILLSDLLEASGSKCTDFTAGDGPKPVLARSIYAVAHYLQISALSELALRCIEDCLTPTTAAQYLVDEWCSIYDEPREMVISYAVQNWAKVKLTCAMKDAIAKRGNGELSPGVTETLLDVMMRVTCA